MVGTGYRLADIGTDHAYIPIYLAERGRIHWAAAMDVNRGPLERAQENIIAAGLGEIIDTRLSDGFASLEPGEADSAVIAGMGGALMIRILQEGIDVVCSLKECILQPQSEVEKVRTFLLEEGFSFMSENIVEEDGKYYPMMCVQPPSVNEDFLIGNKRGSENQSRWSDIELRYGRILLNERHPVLREYLEKEVCIKTQIIEKLETNKSGRAQKRVRELRKELAYAEKGLDLYALQ